MHKFKKISLVIEGFFLGMTIEGFIDITYSHIGIILHISPFILLILSALMVLLGILVVYIFLNNVIRNVKTSKTSYLLLFSIYDFSIILGGYIVRILLSM